MWKFLLSLAITLTSLNCHGSNDVEGLGEKSDLRTGGENYLVKDKKAFDAQVPLLKAGDTITLAKGVWRDCSFKFYGEGTETKPIVLTVEEYGKTSIEGKTSLSIYGNYLIVDGLLFKDGNSSREKMIEFRKDSKTSANHCVLRNCVIEDSFNRSLFEEKDAWINLYGKANTIESCYLGKKTNLGVILIVWLDDDNKENYHHISRNYFAGRPKPEKSTNGLETIRIGTSTYSMELSGTTIQSNYFEYADGETEVVSVKSCENKIIDNTFFECQGSVVLRHGNRNLVAGNYFLGNRKPNIGGVRVINEGHRIMNNYFYQLRGNGYRAPLNIMKGIADTPLNGYHQVKDVEIMFNTWIDCDLTWVLSYGTDKGQDLAPESVQLAYNVVYSDNKADMMQIYGDISGIQFKSNVMKTKDGFYSGEGFVSSELTKYVDAYGQTWMMSSLLTDKINEISSDIEGKSRSEKTPIGALEENQNIKMKTKATRENSGPQWYK